ncbi:MAG: hypothetical protein NVSMB38_11450 [Ktedonobacteraceae bacterium]
MIEMVTRVTQGNAIQEATQIVKRYNLTRPSVQQWICEVCGMVHSGSAPTTCDSCGITNAFIQQQEIRNEIGSRW